MTVPSAVLDLSRWKITLPTGSSGHPTELTGAALQAADIPRTFWVGDDGAVHFRAAVTGVTTSGSGYPRSELRELNADGSLASWSSTDGKTHTMVVDEAVPHLPNPRTSGNAAVVGAQIHDKDNDISVFRVEQGKVWVTKGDDSHFAVADSNYQLGTRFRAMFVVSDGTVSAYYNGKLVVAFPFKGSGLYFKAGAYVQANASNSKPADSSNYGETAIWSVQVAHGAPVPADPPPAPGPTPDPVPPPVPAPADVVMIIWHGEKPSQKSDHTLNAAGYERARRLVGFFTHPKAGIYTPTQIWASKGNTASMRPLQTVQPLAVALGETINTVYDFESAESTVGKALSRLHGVTLACAEHTAIPGVCKKFTLAKGSPKPPKAWPSSRFDLVWTFTRQADGKWLFAQIPEALMSGDQGYAVTPAAGFLAAVTQALGIGR